MKFLLLEIRLTSEAKQAWRWLQTWLVAALAVAPFAYDMLAPLQDLIPWPWFKGVIGAIGVLALVNMVRRKAPAP